MPDLGCSTKEFGEARSASWRISPSRVEFVRRTLLVVIETFFVYFLRPSSSVNQIGIILKRKHKLFVVISANTSNAPYVRRFGHLLGEFLGSCSVSYLP